MKSRRHVYLSLTLTQDELDLVLERLWQAPEGSYPSQLAARITGHLDSQPRDLLTEYEEESPQVLAERGMCDERDCENPLMTDDELEEHGGPEGMCLSCHRKFHETHHFVHGHGPGSGWQRRPEC